MRVCAGKHNLPDDLPVYLSQALSDGCMKAIKENEWFEL